MYYDFLFQPVDLPSFPLWGLLALLSVAAGIVATGVALLVNTRQLAAQRQRALKDEIDRLRRRLVTALNRQAVTQGVNVNQPSSAEAVSMQFISSRFLKLMSSCQRIANLMNRNFNAAHCTWWHIILSLI